jgi:hypothetical protein
VREKKGKGLREEKKGKCLRERERERKMPERVRKKKKGGERWVGSMCDYYCHVGGMCVEHQLLSL